jgi:hypothetical protein
VSGDELGEPLTALWGSFAPATWNQRLAVLGEYVAHYNEHRHRPH